MAAGPQLISKYHIEAHNATDETWYTIAGDGFHGGPSLPILARGASVDGGTKPPPSVAVVVRSRVSASCWNSRWASSS